MLQYGPQDILDLVVMEVVQDHLRFENITYLSFHILDIRPVADIPQAKRLMSFLVNITKSFDSCSYFYENSMLYLLDLCRSYPDEYVRASVFELMFINVKPHPGLTRNSPRIRLLVDMTKECNPNSVVSTKILLVWIKIIYFGGPLDTFLELCQQDGEFVQTFLDIIRYPVSSLYNPEEGFAHIDLHIDARGDAAANWLYYRLFAFIPGMVEIVKRFWPFVTKDVRLIPYNEFLAEIQQMNREESLPKTAVTKR
jgi:hypothetical protein